MDAKLFVFDEQVRKLDSFLKTIKVDELKLVMACIMIARYTRVRLMELYADDDMSGRSSMRGVALACIVNTMASNLCEPDKGVFAAIGEATVEKIKTANRSGKKLWRAVEQAVDDVVKMAIVADIDKNQFSFQRGVTAWLLICKQLIEEASATGCMNGSMGYIASKTRKSKTVPWIPRMVFEKLEAALIGLQEQ